MTQTYAPLVCFEVMNKDSPLIALQHPKATLWGQKKVAVGETWLLWEGRGVIHAGSAVSKKSSFSYRGHTSGLTKKKWRPEDNISPAKK